MSCLKWKEKDTAEIKDELVRLKIEKLEGQYKLNQLKIEWLEKKVILLADTIEKILNIGAGKKY